MHIYHIHTSLNTQNKTYYIKKNVQKYLHLKTHQFLLRSLCHSYIVIGIGLNPKAPSPLSARGAQQHCAGLVLGWTTDSHLPFRAHCALPPGLLWTAHLLPSLFSVSDFGPSLVSPPSDSLLLNSTFWGWFWRGRGTGRRIRVFWMRWLLPFFLKNF